MKIKHFTDVPAEDVEGVEGVGIRWVIDRSDDAPNFAMRVIEVEPGCNTQYHTHGFEHEVYVLDGRGVVRDPDGTETGIEPGTVVYVPPDEKHGFFNTGDGLLRFICVIPHQPGR